MNTLLLVLMAILLICINNKKINRYKNRKKVRFGNATVLNKENFYGNNNKNEEYSIDDDYYIDRMGTKGYMFNKLHDEDIYDCSKLKENEKNNKYKYENYNNIIKKLNLYNRHFYDKGLPDYSPSDLRTPPAYNDPIKDRLRFNQGILFSTNDQIKLKL